MHRPRSVPVLLVAVLALGGCGRDGPRAGPEARAPSLDRSTPEAVLAAAHAALTAADLARLSEAFTEHGMRSLRRDLEAWRAVLADPATGPRAVARLPAPKDATEQEALRRALAGDDLGALLALYLRTDPRPPLPPVVAAPRPADAGQADFDVPAADGGSRWVRLVRTADGWRVDRWNL